jgi:AhpD family alkylhydroperoxidase
MDVDATTASLMAVAASVAANCERCLETSTARALRSGADPKQIAEAEAVGSRVRAGAAAKMDAFIAARNPTPSADPPPGSMRGCC